MASEFTPAPIPDGRIEIDGRPFMGDGKGGFIAVSVIKPQHLMEDELVRDELGWFIALSEQVTRFKQHLFENLGAFEALLAEQYGAKIGGKKKEMPPPEIVG